MNEVASQRIRRFSRFQVLLHWAVALPYLALAASGAIIMLQRLDVVPHLAVDRVRAVHHWIGIGLTVVLVQALFAALVSGQLIALAKDFLEWVLIRPREVLWMLLVPLNILFPRWVHLPAAGRFNAGQKLHGIFILAALGTFSVTGIWMILRPSDLRPWIVHTWFFFGAIGFLALHVFLSLVNPVTRRGLSGVFTGRVSREYLADHHPLTLPDPPPPHTRPHAVVSPKALLMTWAVALAAAAAFTWWYGPERATEQVLHAAAQPPHSAMSPGPLIAAHAADPRITSCQTCHQSMMPPPNSACLSCHDEVRAMMDQKAGFHGQLSGACRECHTDHKGRDAEIRVLDRNEFNHNLARFVLHGEHRSLRCEECHVEHSPNKVALRFIGVSFGSCADCHEDPHDRSLGNDCQRCHDEQGWAGRHLLFNHNRDSDFQIDALHRGVGCAACHGSGDARGTDFRDVAASCAGCHTQVERALAGQIGERHLPADPHAGRVSCMDCHATDARPASSRYADACVRCHAPAYRGLFFEWAQSLDEREHAARRATETLRAVDPKRASALGDELDQATAAGMHNVQQAIRVLEDVAAGARRSAESTAAGSERGGNTTSAR